MRRIGKWLGCLRCLRRIGRFERTSGIGDQASDEVRASWDHKRLVLFLGSATVEIWGSGRPSLRPSPSEGPYPSGVCSARGGSSAERMVHAVGAFLDGVCAWVAVILVLIVNACSVSSGTTARIVGDAGSEPERADPCGGSQDRRGFLRGSRHAGCRPWQRFCSRAGAASKHRFIRVRRETHHGTMKPLPINGHRSRLAVQPK